MTCLNWSMIKTNSMYLRFILQFSIQRVIRKKQSQAPITKFSKQIVFPLSNNLNGFLHVTINK